MSLFNHTQGFGFRPKKPKSQRNSSISVRPGKFISRPKNSALFEYLGPIQPPAQSACLSAHIESTNGAANPNISQIPQLKAPPPDVLEQPPPPPDGYRAKDVRVWLAVSRECLRSLPGRGRARPAGRTGTGPFAAWIEVLNRVAFWSLINWSDSWLYKQSIDFILVCLYSSYYRF